MNPKKFKQQVVMGEWLGLDTLTRQKLAIEFGIGKSTSMSIVDSRIVCDGTTDNDLKGMSIGAMIGYLGSDLPYFEVDLCKSLFSNVLKKFHGQTITIPGSKEAVNCGECERRATEPTPECTREHAECRSEPTNSGTDITVELDATPTKPRRGRKPKAANKAV